MGNFEILGGGGGYPLTFGLGASPFLYMSIHKCTNAESPFSSGPTDPSGHRISIDQLKAPNATPKFTQGILLSTQRIWEAFSLSTRLDCSLIQIIGMPTNANFVFRTRITKFEKPVIDYAEIVSKVGGVTTYSSMGVTPLGATWLRAMGGTRRPNKVTPLSKIAIK